MWKTGCVPPPTMKSVEQQSWVSETEIEAPSRPTGLTTLLSIRQSPTDGNFERCMAAYQGARQDCSTMA